MAERIAEVETEDDEASEGGILYRQHRVYERDAKLIKKKKAQALKANGKLQCEACDFDFEAIYGDRGYGYIEVHHNKPVSQMKPGEKTKLSDLGLLCGNCHRIAHRGKDVLTVAGVKAIKKPASLGQ